MTPLALVRMDISGKGLGGNGVVVYGERQASFCSLYHTHGRRRAIGIWDSAWLIGQCPKDLAPLLFMKMRHKRRLLAEALHDSRWIRDLNINEGFTTTHLLQLINLWIVISPTQLQQQ
jgi:hypothetical protein